MNTIQAIIRMEKMPMGGDCAVVIFPTSVGNGRNTNSCEIYSHIGQHNIVSNIKEFIEDECRSPNTADEKAECFDLIMEITKRYKNSMGESYEIIWHTGKIDNAKYEEWKNARIAFINGE